MSGHAQLVMVTIRPLVEAAGCTDRTSIAIHGWMVMERNMRLTRDMAGVAEESPPIKPVAKDKS